MARLVVGFDNTLSLLFHSFFLDFFSKYAPLFSLGAFLFLGYSPILFCQVNPNNISLLPTKKRKIKWLKQSALTTLISPKKYH